MFNKKAQEQQQSTPDEQILLLVREEAIDNGGFINEKIEIRSINGMLTGMYATAPLTKGERLWRIRPVVSGKTYCETVNKVTGLLRTVEKSYLTPYQRYLISRTSLHHSLPGLWSSAGIHLLEEMLGESWTNTEYLDLVGHWMNHCDKDHEYDKNPDKVDEVIRNAIRIVRARAENDFRALVPFHDVINHARSKHENNAVDGYDDNKGEVWVNARFDIPKGEQVAFSYSMSTNELFLQYGFLESYPRYWQSEYLGLDFQVRRKEQQGKTWKILGPSRDGTTLVYQADEEEEDKEGIFLRHSRKQVLWEVAFDEAPNSETLKTIQKELLRLESFGEDELGSSCSPSFFSVPRIDAIELKLLCDYHAGLVETLRHSEMAASILLGHGTPPLGRFPSTTIHVTTNGIFGASVMNLLLAQNLIANYTARVLFFGLFVGAVTACLWIQSCTNKKKNPKTRLA